MLSAAQLSLGKQLLQDTGTTLVHVRYLQKLFGGRLPKKTFAQWCCRHAYGKICAIDANVGATGLLEIIGLSHSNPPKKYCDESPVLACEYFSEEDLSSGEGASAVVRFVENVVVPELMKRGEDQKDDGLNPVLVDLVKHLQGLPPAYHSNVLIDHKSRLKGVLYLTGRTPFLLGSDSRDLSTFTTDPDSYMHTFIKDDCEWVKKLLDGAYMLHMGEKQYWPKIQEQLASLTDDSDVVTKAKAVTTCLQQYQTWKLNVRPAAILDVVQGQVPDALTKLATECGLMVEGAELQEGIKNPRVQELLDLVSRASSLWSDVRLSLLTTKLQKASQLLNVMGAMTTFRSVCEELSDANDQDDKTMTAVDKLLSSLPDGASTLLMRDATDKTMAVDMMDVVGKRCTKVWPDIPSTLQQLAERSSSQIHLADLHCEEPTSELRVKHEATQECLSLLRVIMQLTDDVRTYEGLAESPQERVKATCSLDKILSMKKLDGELETGKYADLPKKYGVAAGKLTELMKRQKEHVANFESLYQAEGLAHLEQVVAELGQIAGGNFNVPGTSWKQDLPDDCSWSVFKDCADLTVRKISKKQIIKAIRKVVKAPCAACAPLNHVGYSLLVFMLMRALRSYRMFIRYHRVTCTY